MTGTCDLILRDVSTFPIMTVNKNEIIPEGLVLGITVLCCSFRHAFFTEKRPEFWAGSPGMDVLLGRVCLSWKDLRQ